MSSSWVIIAYYSFQCVTQGNDKAVIGALEMHVMNSEFCLDVCNILEKTVQFIILGDNQRQTQSLMKRTAGRGDRPSGSAEYCAYTATGVSMVYRRETEGLSRHLSLSICGPPLVWVECRPPVHESCP